MNKRFSQSALIFFGLVIFFLAGCADGKKVKSTANKSGDIQIYITQTTSYCGGARPSEEILQELNTPIPSPKTKIFIGSGSSNSGKDFVAEFITDDRGKFKLSLPPGEYYLVFETKTIEKKTELLQNHQVETTYYSAMDVDCLEAWFSQPELVFSIPSSSPELVLNKHIPCSWSLVPCVEYRGPLPP